MGLAQATFTFLLLSTYTYLSRAQNVVNCTTLSESGQYVMIEDLVDSGNSSSCFLIAAPDVVLDCNGYVDEGV